MNPEPLSIRMLFRNPGRFYSVEEIFGEIRTCLEGEFAIESVTAPEGGASPRSLLRNLRWARSFSGGVNHITGDITYTALALDGRRTILTVLDTRAICRPMTVKKRLIRYLWFVLPVRRAALVTVISNETAKELKKYVPGCQEKTRVVHCCVPSRFTHRPKKYNSECPRILQVGTTDNKNLERLADALEGVLCRVTILGKPSTEQIERFKLRNVRMEWVSGLSSEEVVGLYSKSDIVSFVSTYEGFGMPIIEANAIGRPVVTSNCSSMPEVAGDAAFFVNPFDAADIRRGIVQVMENGDLRGKLVAAGLQNAKRFRPEVISRRYTALYRELGERIKS